MKKQYIYPKTEVANISGALIMLGASGDIHSGSSSTQTGSQSGAHAPKRFGTPVF